VVQCTVSTAVPTADGGTPNDMSIFRHIPGVKTGGGYKVGQSVYVGDAPDAGPKISRTLDKTATSTGNWTLSWWYKKGPPTTSQKSMFTIQKANGQKPNTHISNDTSGTDPEPHTLVWNFADDYYQSDVSIDDYSAWYHFVVKIRGSQQSFYENGIEMFMRSTSFVDYPPTTGDIFYFDSNESEQLGNGYFADFHFIDGQALGPEHFAAEKDDKWLPIPYTGDYGNNGFRLEFEDGNDIGADSSGNGNDFTTSGMTPDNIVADSPTNNYATWNPLSVATDGGSITLSEGNLRLHGEGWARTDSTIKFPKTGKWYAEHLVMASDGGYDVGATKVSIATSLGPDVANVGNNALSWYPAGQEYQVVTNGGTAVPTAAPGAYPLVPGQTISILFDADANTVSFLVDGGTFSSALLDQPVPITDEYYGFGMATYNGQNWTTNFGQRPFTYTPPEGYLAINSQNMENT